MATVKREIDIEKVAALANQLQAVREEMRPFQIRRDELQDSLRYFVEERGGQKQVTLPDGRVVRVVHQGPLFDREGEIVVAEEFFVTVSPAKEGKDGASSDD